ncbi:MULTISPECIES: toll/interleukin-1 receptor domain-containing protein [unclassified Mesorhizobium]|uniref:toll/interleukin-1 receptor domain-containing protein n=1 Tax=unclassified Mesorhizobium TaxID=325217 RepID=UPI0015E48260|nr:MULTISPECIES: toll/interleukin-1 receptor domain-containing protein [unclassified Mesorhizobium]
MATAFISYTHRDEAFRQELETHLSPLRRQGLLSVWHDRRITPGDHLDDTISEHLEGADLILMLISADFVASEYCYAREMTRALERHQAKKARAVSIICRPCHFEGLPFSRFLLLPTDAKAVSLWPDRDAAWVDVVKGIRSALGTSVALETTQEPEPAPKEPPQIPTPRRSGIRLPRTFTDLDKHDFLETSFERIWAMFEVNAAELEAENSQITVRRVRIDAQSFAVRIFLNGSEVAGGSVYHGGGHFGRDQICFSTDTSAPRNSMNEWFGVEVTDEGLMLKSGGMLRMMDGSREEPVDADRAAEMLWEHLLDRIKARIR